jgi:energy-coupling factor transport system ATP-binding protein
MEPVISFRDVSYRHEVNEEWALNGINLCINQGEWVSIIGRNGSGKSTLARLMNGTLTPTVGVVNAFGKSTHLEENQWELRTTVGMIFQNPENQIIATTVEEDIAFGLENIGVSPSEINLRCKRILKQLDLYAMRDRNPYTLSGGQKQRLAIAGVIVMEPKVIIFDEPTSFIDPKGARDVRYIMSELHQKGVTVIQITHDMEEIVWGNRVIVMQEGTIALQGKPTEILADSESIKDAGLIPPFAVRIRDELIQEGYDLANDIISEKELAEQIWKLSLSKKAAHMRKEPRLKSRH